MKVGTDAILVGALPTVRWDKNVLEVGGGCGVISLMIAQRNSDALICSIDIDKHSAEEAAANFKRSPWTDRLISIHDSFQNYAEENDGKKFDHIVSNPPFFTGDKKSVYPSRTKSRHTVYLSHEDFLNLSLEMSHERSKLSLILPANLARNFIESASTSGLFLIELHKIRPKAGKACNRYLMTFGQQNNTLKEYDWFIYDDHGAYSDHYRAYTHTYYINM